MTAVSEFWRRHPDKRKFLPSVEDMVAEGLLDLSDPRITPQNENQSHPPFFGEDDDDEENAFGWFM